jgi:hypothetical protein
MDIELYYFSGCPSWHESFDSLNEIISSHHHQAVLKLIEVKTIQEANQYQFFGSPTIKVEGKDLFPIEQEIYHLGCRVYKTPSGFKGSPSKEMIEEKLREYFKKETK